MNNSAQSQKERKTKQDIEVNDQKKIIHYSADALIVLLKCMQVVGYGDCHRQRKSVKNIFEAAALLAKEQGIEKNAQTWV